MKHRKKPLIAAVLMLLVLAGCECRHEYDPGVVTKEATCKEEGICTYTCQKCKESYDEPIPLTDHVYSDRVTREPTYQQDGEKTFTCGLCRDSYTEAIPMLESPVVVTVTDKRTHSSYFFDWLELDFAVENIGDTDIRGFQGNVVVCDVFGKELLSSRCKFTEYFPAGETVDVAEMSMLIDEFDDKEKKVFDTSYGDLQFLYELQQVVFAGEDEDDEKIALEGPVTIRIDGLHPFIATPQNRAIQSSIQVTLVMNNHTGKEIKGIDGTLIFRDMFGDELMSEECPLMKKEARDWKEGQGYILHFGINELSREANILYTEYKDLTFEYSLSSILFEDGTQEFFQTPEGTVNL